MRTVLMTATTATCVLVALFILATGAQAINLNEPRFQASGQGEVTTTGSIAMGATALSIADAATWSVGHGIRVRRAGANVPVHAADAGWTLPPGALGGAAVMHDMADKQEGTASVQCSFTGTPPDTDGDGVPGPVDLCEVDLGGPIPLHFDELRTWIKSSVTTTPGDLRLQVLLLLDDVKLTFDLELPALSAGVWTEAFLELKRQHAVSLLQAAGGQILTLRCQRSCAGLTVHLDDLRGVNDFVATVDRIAKTPGGGATFQLNRAAGRTVTSELVYHDDTVAVRTWLQEAALGGTLLVAPPGVYYISTVELQSVGGSLPLYNDTQLRCANPRQTIFKNTGRSETGPRDMFRSVAPAPTNIVIERCGFDWNGWNREDFGSMLLISPLIPNADIVQNVHMHDNSFFDSHLPGIEGCDFGQDLCATRQRHHILVYRVDGVWVENNQMAGGGRIKTGGSGLGRNMHIRDNVLDFVNDNGITIVDVQAGLTEHVEITDNTILNPVTSGIFFGADGVPNDVPGMMVRDVTIARNRIVGFFAGAGINGLLPESVADVHIIENSIQAQRDTPIRPLLQFVNGIALSPGSTAPHIATGIRIEGNSMVAFGRHAVFNTAGMYLTGPMQNLSIINNEVHCNGCSTIERGIWLSSGTFTDVALHNNTVDHAGVALLMGSDASTEIAITNASVLHNSLLNSSDMNAGQITLVVNPGVTLQTGIEARIAENRLQAGTGYGIQCRGAGTFLLTDLFTNVFARNIRGDISGCPVQQ